MDTLSVVLIVGALLTMVFFLVQIRRKRLQIDYAIYWTLFSVFLVVVAVFPGIVSWVSVLLGFEAPVNLVFMAMIFLLIIRLFSITTKLSRQNQQIEDLTQRLAIHEREHEESDDKG